MKDTGFAGRDSELAFLLSAWKAVRHGETRIIGIGGGPGIGKTALVRRFIDLAEPPAVAWASGDADEIELPWGVLAQLTAAIPVIGAVPAFQLRRTDAEPLSVGQALARSLQECKDLVLVVDDADSADRQSMAALRHAARRLWAEPVLLLVVHRSPSEAPGAPGDPRDPGWRRIFESDRGGQLTLGGLSAPDLIRLAVACGHPNLSPAGAGRLHEYTGGHPMHARHLLDELPMHAIVFGQGVLPAPRSVTAVVRSWLSRCTPDGRDLVGAGAVIGQRFSLTAVRDLVDTADVPGAVASAVDAGLLAEVPGALGQTFAFTSAFARGVALAELAPRRRRELHRRAAARAGESENALWHRIAAADGPDPELAADIDRRGRAELARGQVNTAAVSLRHALDLTPRGPQRLPRLLTAVEALLVAGDVVTALEYDGELLAASGAWADYVAGYQLLLTGRVAEASARLRHALAAVREADTTTGAPTKTPTHPPIDPPGGVTGDVTGVGGAPADLEARVTTQLAIIGLLTLSYQDMVEHAATAAATARERWVAAFAWFARTVGLAIAGRGTEALALLSGVDAPGAPAGLDGLVARGMIRLWTDDLAGARHDLNSAVQRATNGETLRIGQALGYLGEAEYRMGALDEAVLHTELSIGDAQENDRAWDYALLHTLASYPLAAQGAWERAEWHAARATEWARTVGTPAGLAYAAASRVAVAHARGDGERLLAAAEELEAVYPTAEPGTLLVGPVSADALSRLGRVAEARRALAAFARIPTADRASTRLCVERVRAQIAAADGDHDAALRACDEARLLANRIGLRLESARIELQVATYLSAAGRRAAAERALRSAYREFTAMGAAAYGAQAQAEADRAGFTLRAEPTQLGALTPAERTVVTLVCEGLTNRQVAERLVLSAKTVEFHLRNAFHKLDVANRAELRHALGRMA